MTDVQKKAWDGKGGLAQNYCYNIEKKHSKDKYNFFLFLEIFLWFWTQYYWRNQGKSVIINFYLLQSQYIKQQTSELIKKIVRHMHRPRESLKQSDYCLCVRTCFETLRTPLKGNCGGENIKCRAKITKNFRTLDYF